MPNGQPPSSQPVVALHIGVALFAIETVADYIRMTAKAVLVGLVPPSLRALRLVARAAFARP